MTATTRKPPRLYEAYVFDLDGTVYLGDALLPEAGATIQYLREAGKRTVFLSNNPTCRRADYAAKLTGLGLPTPPEDVLNSSLVMAHFLQERMPGATLFVVGEQPLQDELHQAGFTLSEDPNEIEAVIASFDRTFTYHKLQVAFDAIRAGARFFATNADRYCPVPGGGEPDAAAMIAAIEASTNTRVEVVVGKPSQYMAAAILQLVARPAEACIMIGDRLETDVLMGKNHGMASALTLTGATGQADLEASEIAPDYVLTNLGDLIPG
ncbi:MAG: HAD-IIA family hydrolase [Anaerolineales bacterium]|nr:HAD-IIA family hydrolase [Anaerolineales bacterium]